jgi:hypothetical protein
MLTVWHRAGMPRGYSRNLRERLLEAETSGLTASEVASCTCVAARAPNLLLAAIVEGLQRVTSKDIANCYRHYGYQLPKPAG